MADRMGMVINPDAYDRESLTGVLMPCYAR